MPSNSGIKVDRDTFDQVFLQWYQWTETIKSFNFHIATKKWGKEVKIQKIKVMQTNKIRNGKSYYNRFHRTIKDHKRWLWTIICSKMENLEEMDTFLIQTTF